MTNPYVLVEDIDGIGFKTADKIASKLGIEFDSEIRIRAGIIFVLNEIAEKQGSTVALLDNFILQVSEVLEFSESEKDKVEQAIIDLEIAGLVRKVNYLEKESIAVSKYYYMERYIAKKLLNLCNGCEIKNISSSNEIEQYETLNGISLHEKQREAIIAGTSEPVTVITGGPGTGKTTIIKGILSVFKNAKMKCTLMAPTGRAAKRLEEQTGEPASTIHRALESNFAGGGGGGGYYGGGGGSRYGGETDVVIIDEVSMLDVFLMNSLLKAVSYGTRLVLVGDKDQLPSVGAGNVLADIISSEMFKVVELSQIFRQSEDSMIIVNAHKINRGEPVVLDNKSWDFFFPQPPSSIPNVITPAKSSVPIRRQRVRFIMIPPFLAAISQFYSLYHSMLRISRGNLTNITNCAYRFCAAKAVYCQ